jgi:hypothetical protein
VLKWLYIYICSKRQEANLGGSVWLLKEGRKKDWGYLVGCFKLARRSFLVQEISNGQTTHNRREGGVGVKTFRAPRHWGTSKYGASTDQARGLQESIPVYLRFYSSLTSYLRFKKARKLSGMLLCFWRRPLLLLEAETPWHVLGGMLIKNFIYFYLKIY